jgi:hypothetical protein
LALVVLVQLALRQMVLMEEIQFFQLLQVLAVEEEGKLVMVPEALAVLVVAALVDNSSAWRRWNSIYILIKVMLAALVQM